jgi:hypothetical protein
VRRRSLRTATILALAALTFVLAACGGDDDENPAETPGSESVPAPEASAFPTPSGDINSLTNEITPSDQYVVSPAGQVYHQGRNRFGFGVFTAAGVQVTDAEVAIYAQPGPTGRAIGPFPARIENLQTESEFAAETTSGDPDAARAVYVTEVPFDQSGEWRLMAAIKDGDELVGTLVPSVEVSAKDTIPEIGEKPPVIHTPTVEDVGGEQNLGKIDTRVPPSSMHDVDFADVVGKKPVVLLFATPALCTSRVCGPVVDVAEQVKSEVGDDVAFIHQEIYANNKPPNVRPQVADFKLQTEPWLFVIDADGRVSSRIEGAFSVSELQSAVDRVTQ